MTYYTPQAIEVSWIHALLPHLFMSLVFTGGMFFTMRKAILEGRKEGAPLVNFRRKTGALLTACLRLGGVYAGVGTNEDRLLQQIGDALGLLFQIGDDILDVESSTEILGKTAGKDERARKLTYPGLFGIEESRRKLAAIAAQAVSLTHSLPSHREVFESLIGYLSERDR